MTDWQSLRNHVATSYPVSVDELERFPNPEFDGLSVWVATSRGQRLVILLRRRDFDDHWFLQFSAPIATTGSPDPMALLEWNGRGAAGALVMGEGDLFFRREYPLDWLDVAKTDTALRDVAATSGSLETMLAERGSI